MKTGLWLGCPLRALDGGWCICFCFFCGNLMPKVWLNKSGWDEVVCKSPEWYLCWTWKKMFVKMFVLRSTWWDKKVGYMFFPPAELWSDSSRDKNLFRHPRSLVSLARHSTKYQTLSYYQLSSKVLPWYTPRFFYMEPEKWMLFQVRNLVNTRGPPGEPAVSCFGGVAPLSLGSCITHLRWRTSFGGCQG